MDDERRFIEANKRHWNETVPIHVASDLYSVDLFKAGLRSVREIERRELGDVRGKSLLHLQCHFGLDTMAWARLGARATGIDFSDAAIEQARALAAELDIDARFVCSELYSLPDVLDEAFDVVFTSYGALGWLPDLERWARVVAHFTKPGGTFYIAEFHPTAWIFDNDDPAVTDWRAKYSYFRTALPYADESGIDYADPAVPVSSPSYSWPYTIGEVVTGLARNGFRIEFLHEYPYSVYPQFPFLEGATDGTWRAPEHLPAVPMLFSLRATRELDDRASR